MDFQIPVRSSNARDGLAIRMSTELSSKAIRKEGRINSHRNIQWSLEYQIVVVRPGMVADTG